MNKSEAVSTCIDQICENLIMDETGMVGGIMLVGGVIGTVVLPALSDKIRKRKPFLVVSMIFMLFGLVRLTVFHEFVPMLISAFIFGSFIKGAGAGWFLICRRKKLSCTRIHITGNNTFNRADFGNNFSFWGK